MTVNICYASTEPNVGLRMNMDRMRLKPYFADTGLLVSTIFDESEEDIAALYSKILFNKLEVDLGMVIENVVAQILVSTGKKLYFYSNSNKDDSSARMEIDFLIRKDRIRSRHNIIPLEVKSGTRFTTTSLDKFVAKYGEYSALPVVIWTDD